MPLSITPPVPVEPYHHKLTPGTYPLAPAGREVWAKCDMLTTVGLARLDRVKIDKRRYAAPIISATDLTAIRRCILHALGLSSLTRPPVDAHIEAVPALLRHRACKTTFGRQAPIPAITSRSGP